MSEFNFKSRKNLVKVTIEGKEYSFDVSPTNGRFIKQVATMAREVESLSAVIASMQDPDWASIDKAFDLIMQKQKEIIDFVAPGEWDSLYKAAGEDVLNMTDLVAFIGGEIQSGFTRGKIDEVTPVAPSGEAV